MEAIRRQTIDDLIQAWAEDERLELIDGEIVQRPMARFEHGLAQSGLIEEIAPLKRQAGPRGWWIVPEVSVRYNEHQCPSHDLAGWRPERLPSRPRGVMTLAPNWVCEILSPGHERKDLVHHLLLLQRVEVPYYWIISPEDRSLIAYALDDGRYKVIFSAEYAKNQMPERVRIPPFEAGEIDLGAVFGESEPED
jgi:Uma2 family endonuclease